MFTIIRKIGNDKCIHGELFYGGELLCYTLERPRGSTNGEPVCIPSGTYKTKMVYSPHFKTKLPQLLDVPSRTNILIHAGNYVKDTDGCILVGLDSRVFYLEHSKEALAKVLSIIKDDDVIEILEEKI